MYQLNKNDPVQDTGYYVAESGLYSPVDLVPCSLEVDGQVTVAFLAIFIATGKINIET